MASKAATTTLAYDTAAPPDRGCWAAPSCTSCPWARCVLDLSGAEVRKLADALRVVKVLARPDLTSGRSP